MNKILATIVTAAWALATPMTAVAEIDAGALALEQGDVAEAIRQFEASLAAGEGDGAFYLGRMHEFGLGVTANMDRARQLYQAAAEADSALAMNRLGLMYVDGQNVIKDYLRGH